MSIDRAPYLAWVSEWTQLSDGTWIREWEEDRTVEKAEAVRLGDVLDDFKDEFKDSGRTLLLSERILIDALEKRLGGPDALVVKPLEEP